MNDRQTSLTLYAAPMTSATPVVTALMELDVPHERIMLDLTDGKHKSSEFLALNPNGKVPTLVVDGTPMFEALAIMQWLGDRFGVSRGVWPEVGDPARLRALSWSTWAYVSYASWVSRFVHAGSPRFPSAYHNAALAEHALAELQSMLGVLDRHLAGEGHVLGAQFSLADLIVGCSVAWSTMCGVSLERHAHVSAWLQRVRARPAFEASWSPPGA